MLERAMKTTGFTEVPGTGILVFFSEKKEEQGSLTVLEINLVKTQS